MMGKDLYVREMREYFCQERDRVKRFREQVEEEKASRNTGSVASGIASQRVLGASYKCCNDTDCTQRMMKQGFYRPEKWRLGRMLKHFQEECESLGMGL